MTKRSLFFAMFLLAAPACGSDSTGPADEPDPTPPANDTTPTTSPPPPDSTPPPPDTAQIPADSIAGSYTATEFTTGADDVIAAGGSLTLDLALDGTASGRLVVPEEVGGPLDADMAGTYEVTGATIEFTQDADTFVRDAEWTWSPGGVLDGVWTGSGVTITVRMERQ